MADPLVIVGSGGFALEVYWLAEESGVEVLGFLDDRFAAGSAVLDRQVLGRVADWPQFASASFAVAIGAPRTRQRVVAAMEAAGRPRFATLVHPTVRASRFVKYGEGTIVTAGCILTADIEIGRHNILNLNVTVGHECRFGDFVTLAPLAAISGNVILADTVEIGTGAAIRQGVQMEAGSMLGMGGVLTKNVEPNAIYVGNPAKYLKSLA